MSRSICSLNSKVFTLYLEVYTIPKGQCIFHTWVKAQHANVEGAQIDVSSIERLNLTYYEEVHDVQLYVTETLNRVCLSSLRVSRSLTWIFGFVDCCDIYNRREVTACLVASTRITPDGLWCKLRSEDVGLLIVIFSAWVAIIDHKFRDKAETV